jgi:hypothetical protein
MSLLRIELFFDDEAGNWHYRVPAPHINGGDLPSRQDAEQDCLSAIAFALEGNPADFDPGAEALTLDVTVAPAASIRPGAHWQPDRGMGACLELET